MGTTSSSTHDGSNLQPENQTSGVRITGSAIKSNEELLQDSYNRGKQEALATFDQLAAEVYDRATAQIADAQTRSLETSEKIIKELQQRFQAPKTAEIKFCVDPRQRLLQCLEKSQQNPLACNRVVEEYFSCVTTEFETN